MRWAKEDAVKDIEVRLDRTLAGLESHRELVLAEEAERRSKADADTDERDTTDKTEKPVERQKIQRTYDFEALRKKYIEDAEKAISRIEETFETTGLPKNQKYIAVPPRSVTVLVGEKFIAGEE